MSKNNNQKKFSVPDRISAAFDGVVGIVSPKAAYKRSMYRVAKNVAKSQFGSYDAADNKELRTWNPGTGSADEDILVNQKPLRARSRDLVRNSGVASGVIDTLGINTVGTGLKPQSRVDHKALGISDQAAAEFQIKAERAWDRFVPHADAAERLNFYQMQDLVERQKNVNGEAIILPLMLDEPFRPYRLALQMIEADRLGKEYYSNNNDNIRGGIKIGDHGQPVEYHIRKTVSGKYYSSNNDEFMIIPARNEFGRKNVLHIFKQERPGQSRGVPCLAPVMILFHDLQKYMEAEIISARLVACFSVFVKKVNALESAISDGDTTDSSGNRRRKISPGFIEYLEEGEEIQAFNPQRPGGNFEPFVVILLRMISTGLGLPYELVSKDFSKTNYSSARAALLQAYRGFKKMQSDLISDFCKPVWCMLMEEAFLRGELGMINFYDNPDAWCRSRWIADGWGHVDPLKEAKASEVAISAGISCVATEAAARGEDWEELLDQQAREYRKKKELGLPVNDGSTPVDPAKKKADDKKVDEVINETEDENDEIKH